MGPVPPLTAHWFYVGLVDYVAASLQRAMTLHRKGRQGRAVRRTTALYSPIYHPGRPGCDRPQRPPPPSPHPTPPTPNPAIPDRLKLNLLGGSGQVLKSAEWRNEVSSRSSAPVTSRSSQIPLALDLPSQTNQVRALYSKSGFVLCCSRNVGY